MLVENSRKGRSAGRGRTGKSSYGQRGKTRLFLSQPEFTALTRYAFVMNGSASVISFFQGFHNYFPRSDISDADTMAEALKAVRGGPSAVALEKEDSSSCSFVTNSGFS